MQVGDGHKEGFKGTGNCLKIERFFFSIFEAGRKHDKIRKWCKVLKIKQTKNNCGHHARPGNKE